MVQKRCDLLRGNMNLVKTELRIKLCFSCSPQQPFFLLFSTSIMSVINNLLISVYEPEKREDSDRGREIIRNAFGDRSSLCCFQLSAFCGEEFFDFISAGILIIFKRSLVRFCSSACPDWF